MELASNVSIVTNILMMVISDLENASRLYDKLFESIIRINYSATVYKQLDRLVSKVFKAKVNLCKLILTPGAWKIAPNGGRNLPERGAAFQSIQPIFSCNTPSNFRAVLQFSKILQLWEASQPFRKKMPSIVQVTPQKQFFIWSFSLQISGVFCAFLQYLVGCSKNEGGCKDFGKLKKYLLF